MWEELGCRPHPPPTILGRCLQQTLVPIGSFWPTRSLTKQPALGVGFPACDALLGPEPPALEGRTF